MDGRKYFYFELTVSYIFKYQVVDFLFENKSTCSVEFWINLWAENLPLQHASF